MELVPRVFRPLMLETRRRGGGFCLHPRRSRVFSCLMSSLLFMVAFPHRVRCNSRESATGFFDSTVVKQAENLLFNPQVVILGSGIRSPQTGLQALSRALLQRGIARKIQVQKVICLGCLLLSNLLKSSMEVFKYFMGSRVKGQDVAFEPAKLLWIIQRDVLHSVKSSWEQVCGVEFKSSIF